MKNNININRLLLPVILATLCILAACAPVHRFTRVKKIPREYSLNYCREGVKAPRTSLNKEPWIVYSDRTENQTYNRAAGKVKAKDIDYLDPFLVIGRKKEYLKLIKYTPDILKNGKLEYKNAEYYGWIHRSRLLLNHQSVTDIASGRKNKLLSIIGDTIPLLEAERFLPVDSFRLFKDPGLLSEAGSIAPHSIVYPLKSLPGSTSTLVAGKPFVKAETVADDIIGWIDNSLIRGIGTVLHLKHSSLYTDSSTFYAGNKTEAVSVSGDMETAQQILAESYPVFKYNPVLSYSAKDSLIAFKTHMALPVFDYSDNYIFNVDGTPISYSQYRHIAVEQKKINLSFVFEGREQTLTQFPQIVNALQSLQAMFEQPDGFYSFRFNSILTFNDSRATGGFYQTDFYTDYAQLIDTLSEKAKQVENLKPVAQYYTWNGLRRAVNLFDTCREETNLIVLIGDRGFSRAAVDSTLARKLVDNNCRIIAFQMHAGEGDDYNNFVLDAEDMINYYAYRMLKTKRELLVSPKQIKRYNLYTLVGETNNGYRLDFPDRSITQGGLFFPAKSENLPMEILTANIDTMITQIKQDNREVTGYMAEAFRTVGNNRTRFDSLFVRNFGMDSTIVPSKKQIARFAKESPAWYLPSRAVFLRDTVNHVLDYHLLLSASEMKDLREFIAALSEREVDFILDQKKKIKRKRKPCNCPDDDLFLEREEENALLLLSDTVEMSGKYVNTKNVRRHLTRTLLQPIRYCKLCKEKKSTLKSLTLAEAQFRITGCPSSTPLLNNITIRELRKKKVVDDSLLDELVTYYKRKLKELDKAEPFESNGETYYWLDKRYLP